MLPFNLAVNGRQCVTDRQAWVSGRDFNSDRRSHRIVGHAYSVRQMRITGCCHIEAIEDSRPWSAHVLGPPVPGSHYRRLQTGKRSLRAQDRRPDFLLAPLAERMSWSKVTRTPLGHPKDGRGISPFDGLADRRGGSQCVESVIQRITPCIGTQCSTARPVRRPASAGVRPGRFKGFQLSSSIEQVERMEPCKVFN